MSSAFIDTAAWPLVHYVMPEKVADGDAEAHMKALDAVLNRNEPFVLIFSGAEIPRDSSLFLSLYRQWGKRTLEQQKRFCRGAVRVEPDAAKRKSLWRKALRYVASKRAPYPYVVVATETEAEIQARKWLSS